MIQFIAAHEDDTVLGEAVLSFVNSTKRGQEARSALLQKHLGTLPEPEKWYNLQSYLNALKEISETVGENTLFLLGVALIENAPAPPSVTLREALFNMHDHYQLHHQLHRSQLAHTSDTEDEEEELYWTIVEFNTQTHKVEMRSRTPYPSKMEEGILTGLLHKYKPTNATKLEVKIDITKDRRTEGGNSCTYLLSW